LILSSSLPTQCQDQKYNPSSFTPKTNPKPLKPGIGPFLKSPNKEKVETAKERSLQRACCTRDDTADLADCFGKMSMGGSKK
jgi:hypothetical protein